MFKEEYQGIVYRFMGIKSFEEICSSKALTFVHHTLWEDPYEGFIYQAIARPEQHDEIRKLIKEIGPDIPSIAFDMLHDFSSTLFGQSWTKEGDALWDLYPPNNQGKSLRVQINTANLKKIPASKEWEKVGAFEIHYVDAPNLKEELSLSIKGNQISFGNTLLRKRKAEFQHEQEVRLTVMDWDYSLFNQRNAQSKVAKIQMLQQMLIAGQISRETFDYNVRDDLRVLNKLKTPKIRKVLLTDLSLIEAVNVHPRASNEYADTIESICSKNGIKFLGSP